MTLSIPNIGPGTFDEIRWYKGNRDSNNNRIYLYIMGLADQYENDWCPDVPSPCGDSSTIGEVNKTTGELTIYSAQITDDEFYYADLLSRGSIEELGSDYELAFFVYGKLMC